LTQLALQMPPAREAGMSAALEHAGDAWKNAAYTFLCRYARAAHPNALFTGEDISDAHIAAGEQQPPDLRAWGALYQRARRERVLAVVDNNGRSWRRASPCTRYRSMVSRT
jgi:hypothetical protein